MLPLAADIQNDPPTLAPVAIDGVDHHVLMTGDGLSPGHADATVKRLRRLLAMVRFCDRCECRTDQMQNNPDNRQSHKQFDQAEASLIHVVFLPGVMRAVRSMHG
ncbi:hypothetical protein D3C85_917320 [compost metagenome]